MKKTCVFLLCLLLLFPCMASAQDHLLLQEKNQGACTSMSGAIQLMVVYVDTPDASWDEASIAAFQPAIDSAVFSLEAEAAAYGAELSFQQTSYSSRITNSYEYYWDDDLMTEALSHVSGIFVHFLQNGVLQTPVLLCFAQDGRSFSMASDMLDLEYAVLYQNADADDIRHEILHLFGASDLYIHNDIQAAAMRYFPDSIMLHTDPESTVDSLTAWCIGWTENLSAEADGFLSDTAHITLDSLTAAQEENLKTGFFIHEDEYGIYTGTMVNGVYHGDATYLWHDGNTYAGQYQNGLKHGMGIYTWTDGSVYTGQFQDDALTGAGRFESPDGTIYIGEFLNGMYHGKGTIMWPDGITYTGQFLSGEISGQGVMTWPDGSVYIGEFINSEYNGHGIQIWPDGSLYTGDFIDHQYQGEGVYMDSEGNITQGLYGDIPMVDEE